MTRLVWLFVAACAASPSRQSAAPEPITPAPLGRSDVQPYDPHQRITYLAQQIDTQRTKLELPAPALATAQHATPMAETPASDQCTHGASQVCRDTCSLADAICRNAAEICQIASELQ